MLILGIDGGGTKTHALAVNEHGEVIGFAEGGASGYHSLGIDQAIAVIRDTVYKAIGNQQPDHTAYCLACCDSATDHTKLTGAIQQLGITPDFTLYNDTFAALRAGITKPYGVAVICGTGINACAIAPDGEQTKLYSLGSLTGDWGGGYSLGEAACGAIYRANDRRGSSTVLSEMVLSALHEPNLDTLADRITNNTLSHDEIVQLSPLVFAAAEMGDKVSREIIERLGTEIATIAIASMDRLAIRDVEIEVVLAGGVINGQGPLLMETISAQVREANPRTILRRLEGHPVAGAVLLGFDALGIKAPAKLIQAVSNQVIG